MNYDEISSFCIAAIGGERERRRHVGVVEGDIKRERERHVGGVASVWCGAVWPKKEIEREGIGSTREKASERSLREKGAAASSKTKRETEQNIREPS